MEGAVWTIKPVLYFGLILIALFPFSSEAIIQEGKRVALVVGNGEYHQAEDVLINPPSDANAIAEKLQLLGFHVTEAIDQDRLSMSRSLREFTANMQGAELALFFYAGHGMEYGGKNYLFPIDTSLDSPADLHFSLVELDEIIDLMESEVATRLVFLDACRDNPMAQRFRSSLGATRGQSVGRGLARVDGSVGTFIAFSTAPGSLAADGTGRHSPFAKAMLEHMGKPGLDVERMMRQVRDSVLRETNEKQVPWSNSSLRGTDVYLNPQESAPLLDNAEINSPSLNSPTNNFRNQSHQAEIVYWQSIAHSTQISAFEAYLARFGANALFADLAKLRIKTLKEDVDIAVLQREEQVPKVPLAAKIPRANQNPTTAGDQLATYVEENRVKQQEPRLDRGEWRDIQRTLAELGHKTGPADGFPGRVTRRGIANWQQKEGVAATGYLQERQVATLLELAKTTAEPLAPEPEFAQPRSLEPNSNVPVPLGVQIQNEAKLKLEADHWQRIQNMLMALNFEPGNFLGFPDAVTRVAISNWQQSKGIPVSGYLDQNQYSKLATEAEPKLAALAASRVRPTPNRQNEVTEPSEEKVDRSHEPGDRIQDCGNCPVLTVIPPGKFQMGSSWLEEGRHLDEGPTRQVTISKPFAVGIYEITTGEWAACLDDGGCNGYRPLTIRSDSRLPASEISWRDANAYVKWISQKTGQSYRLLTEAEWEYVARARTTTPFHFGSTISTDQANYKGSRTYGDGARGVNRLRTLRVGSFPPNQFGLHDMHGNVGEWVQDPYNLNYRGAPSDGSAWTPLTGASGVLRGGSFAYSPGNVRSAYRESQLRDLRLPFFGFRVARDLYMTTK